jgi:hypothetical protein
MARTKNKSRAEIQRAYRLRQLNLNSAAFKAKERERWKRRRLNRTVKVVSDLSYRDHRLLRRKWKLQKPSYRRALQALHETPPADGSLYPEG